MVVCVAEKPSVGAYIANVLGAKQKHDGYFEGNGYQVTWTFGHLCALLDPQEYAGSAGIYGAMESLEPKFAADDSAAFFHQSVR